MNLRSPWLDKNYDFLPDKDQLVIAQRRNERNAEVTNPY